MLPLLVLMPCLCALNPVGAAALTPLIAERLVEYRWLAKYSLHRRYGGLR